MRAFGRLDELLGENTVLLLGGGGAMILAHGFPLATSDIDAVPQGTSVSALDKLVKQIALELGLPGDWLNPYFSTFLHTLPSDYSERLITVFKGKRLQVQALGATDMLILKCFAGRQKDVGHAKTLLKKGADVKRVEKHFETLSAKKIPGVERALEFLDDLLDQA
jgi:hypothetical protein